MLSGKHILVENCPGLGDLVMVTPALRKIKELYPDCILSVVSYANNLPLVNRLPYVDHVYAIEKGKFLGHFRPVVAFPEQDYVIFTTWQPQLARMAWLMRVPNRAGVTKENGRGRNLFTVELPENDFRAHEHRADFLGRQIGAGLGINLSVDDACGVSEPSESEMDSVRQTLTNEGKDLSRPFVVFAPFAKSEKSIPTPLLLETVRYVKEKYDLDCVFSHTEHMPAFDEIRKKLGSEYIYDVSGKMKLMELVALMKSARTVIATDSGPMHISCAMGTETVAVFSSGNHRRWTPKCHSHLVTLDCDCSPCDGETSRRCASQKCILDITPGMVKEKIDEAMEALR